MKLTENFCGPVPGLNLNLNPIESCEPIEIPGLDLDLNPIDNCGGGGNIGDGAKTFLQLLDTPSSYVDQGGLFLRVNASETGVEFAPIVMPDLSDFVTKTGGPRQTISRETEIQGPNFYITNTPESSFSESNFVVVQETSAGQVRRIGLDRFSPVSPSGDYIYASPDDPQAAFIDVIGNIKSANYVEAGVSLRVGNAYIGGMLDTFYNNVLYGSTRIRSGGSLEIESGDNAVIKLFSASGATGNSGFWDMRHASFLPEAPLNFYKDTDLQLSLYNNQLYDGLGTPYAKGSPSGDYIYANPSITQNAYIDVQGTITSRTNLVSNGTLVVDGNASINGNGIYLPGVNSEFTGNGLSTPRVTTGNTFFTNGEIRDSNGFSLGTTGADINIGVNLIDIYKNVNLINNSNLTAEGSGTFGGNVTSGNYLIGHRLSLTSLGITGSIASYIDNGSSALLFSADNVNYPSAQLRYEPSTLPLDSLGRPRMWINANGGAGNIGVIAYTDDIPTNISTNPSAFTAGRIPYTTGANTLADSTNLAWDNTNRVFILGGSRPTFRLNNTAGGAEIVNIGATASSQFFGIRGSGNIRDAFSIGSSLSNLSRKFGFNANFTDIPLETTYYMYGGGSGANLDIRASTNPTEQDQAIVEMQSGDFETTFQSTWLRQVGSRSTDSDIITGMTLAGMGMLRFQSTSKSVISTASDTLDGSNALQIWTDNAKILQFTKTGVNYASDFSASNTSNPRWLTDKGFVDGRLATGQTIGANTTGNAASATKWNTEEYAGVTNTNPTGEVLAFNGTSLKWNPTPLSGLTAGSATLWNGQTYLNTLRDSPFSFMVNNAGSWGYTGVSQVKTALATSLQDVTSVGFKTNNVLQITDAAGSSLSKGLTFYYSPANNAGYVSSYDYPNSTALPLILNANGGNVGIGVTPANTFEVRGSALTIGNETTYAAKFSNGNSKGILLGYDDTRSSGVISAIDPGVAWKDIIINPNGGNLGIGKTPTVALDVNGSAKFTNIEVADNAMAFRGLNYPSAGLKFNVSSGMFEFISTTNAIVASIPAISNGNGLTTGNTIVSTSTISGGQLQMTSPSTVTAGNIVVKNTGNGILQEIAGGISIVSRDSILSLTANRTLTLADWGVSGMLTIYADASSAGFTITMPNGATMTGYTLNVIKTDASANGVTISGNVNINGMASLSLSTQYQATTIKSNSTQYYQF